MNSRIEFRNTTANTPRNTTDGQTDVLTQSRIQTADNFGFSDVREIQAGIVEW